MMFSINDDTWQQPISTLFCGYGYKQESMNIKSASLCANQVLYNTVEKMDCDLFTTLKHNT